MTDFDTPLVPEETPEPEPEVTPPTPEEVAKAYLKEKGIDPDTFDFKKAADLQGWAKDLNKKSSEVGAIAKRLEAAPAAPTAATPKFDPEELANLKEALKVVGIDVDAVKSSMSATAQALEDERAAVAEAFFAANTDIPSEQLIQSLYEDGVNLNTITPTQLRRQLDKAYKVAKASAFDPEERAKELAAKMVEEMQKDGQIVGVKKSRASGGGHKTIGDVMDDPTATFFDKMDAMASIPE